MLMPFTKDFEEQILGFVRQARSGRYVMIEVKEEEIIVAAIGREEMDRRVQIEDDILAHKLQMKALETPIKPAPWWKVWK